MINTLNRIAVTAISGAERRRTLLYFGAIAAFVLITDIIGLVLHFSPVPYWDMWDGYLDFYLRVSEGDFSAWTYQHNEHRIVLTRILFWIDINVFGGTEVFLITMNMLLVFSTAVIMVLVARTVVEQDRNGLDGLTLQLTIFIMTMSWMQHENLTWAFQSQFILAYLLPLISFWSLQLSQGLTRLAPVWFATALLFGLLSSISMANGVLALPLMVVMALLFRMSVRRVSILAFASILMLVTYFRTYHSPPGHGSLLETLVQDPLSIILYGLAYIGSPAPQLIPGGPDLLQAQNLLLAQIFGMALLVIFILLSWRVLAISDRPRAQIAIVIFLTFIAASATATAGGRAMFGLDQALSGRYLTPAVLAWAALLVLASPYFVLCAPRAFRFFLVIVALLFIPPQFDVFESQSARSTERLIAAMSLELDIEDPLQVTSTIYPSFEHAASIARRARKKDLSIFGNPLIKDAGALIGKKIPIPPSVCAGNVDLIAPLITDDEFTSVTGWVFSPEHGSVPRRVVILDQAGDVAGFAFSGLRREDVASQIGNPALYSGFRGYMRADAREDDLSLVGQDDACTLTGIRLRARSETN